MVQKKKRKRVIAIFLFSFVCIVAVFDWEIVFSADDAAVKIASALLYADLAGAQAVYDTGVEVAEAHDAACARSALLKDAVFRIDLTAVDAVENARFADRVIHFFAHHQRRIDP